MLTVDFDRLGVRPGDRALDVGCGNGRHAFEMVRCGAVVVALDRDAGELAGVRDVVAAMRAEGQVPAGGHAEAHRGDALALPFGDGSFDRVVAAEVLEHIPDDRRAIEELVRVLRPGGTLAVTVPRALPERICWWLSEAYHTVPGGHIRIYPARDLTGKLVAAGLEPTGRHHAHALHTPYWWLRCAVGVDRDDHPLVAAYHRFLVWDIVSRPALTRWAERLLNPVLGKSLVLYLRKPA